MDAAAGGDIAAGAAPSGVANVAEPSDGEAPPSDPEGSEDEPEDHEADDEDKKQPRSKDIGFRGLSIAALWRPLSTGKKKGKKGKKKCKWGRRRDGKCKKKD